MQINWDLDSDSFIKIHSFSYPHALTWGNKDKENREKIRSFAEKDFPKDVKHFKWWAFRIVVQKSGNRDFDVENVPKLIIDSFCKKQINMDGSKFSGLVLFEDDTIDYVKIIQVYGERTLSTDSTQVEIFGKILDR